MTRIPRISGNVMIKYLIKQNFTIATRKGSHVTLRRDYLSVTIPARNSRLKIGLLLGVLNKADINKEKFMDDWNHGIVK